MRAGAAANPVWSTYQHSPITAMNNKSTFEERIATMRQAAHDLRGIAEYLFEEVIHMEAAQLRFADRKSSRPTTRTASR